MPYKSWGDVVDSQMPKLVVPEDAKVDYRVRKKPKAMKRNPKKALRKDRAQTTLGGMR